MREKAVLTAGILSLFLLFGCDSGDADSGPVPGSGTVGGVLCQGEGDCGDETFCEGQGDCGDGSFCVRARGKSSCQLNCSFDADLCGAEASCISAGATSLSINVCQPDPTTLEELMEFGPEDQPMLPCSTDDDCQQFSNIAICATSKGVSDCTVPCDEADDCKMSAQVQGMTINFLECSVDEGDGSRNACLPNPVCEEDPTDRVCFMSIFGEPTEEEFPAFNPFPGDED